MTEDFRKEIRSRDFLQYKQTCPMDWIPATLTKISHQETRFMRPVNRNSSQQPLTIPTFKVYRSGARIFLLKICTDSHRHARCYDHMRNHPTRASSMVIPPELPNVSLQGRNLWQYSFGREFYWCCFNLYAPARALAYDKSVPWWKTTTNIRNGL